MRTSIHAVLVTLLVILHLTACGQEDPLSLSARIDSLQDKLSQHPTDQALIMQLVNEYAQSGNPELALLEILNAENLGVMDQGDSYTKGQLQFEIGQIEPASKTLRRAYLEHPSDDALRLLAVLDYARGNSDRGRRLLQRIASRSPNILIDLSNLYQRLLSAGENPLVTATGNAIRDLNSTSSAELLAKPKIILISPAHTSITDSDYASVVFEVRHVRPLRSVDVKEDRIYELTESSIPDPRESFVRQFRQRIRLTEGKNVVRLSAKDVFETEAIDSVTIYNTNFSPPVSYTSALAESLVRSLALVQSYIPDSIIAVSKDPFTRCVVVAGSERGTNRGTSDRGLLVYDVFTNPMCGNVVSENAKCLLGNQFTDQALQMILENWLLPNISFQSTSILYLSGEWRIAPDGWYLTDVAGRPFNVKPLCGRLSELGSTGLVLLFDGTIDDRKALATQVSSMLKGTPVPMQAMIFPSGDWTPTLLSLYRPPELSAVIEGGSGVVTVNDLVKILAGADVISNGKHNVPLFYNLARRVNGHYSAMLTKLANRLKAENVSVVNRNTILTFCRDWRRFNEVSRFLSRQLPLSEFLARIREYNKRMSGGRSENE